MSENGVKDTRTSSRWGLAVGAGFGVISGAAAAVVATALGVSFADEARPAEQTTPSPHVTVADGVQPTGADWPATVTTGAGFPKASVMTPSVLDQIGDLWRFESVRDFDIKGPIAFYLASPDGTRYEVATSTYQFWHIEHWDVASNTVLLRKLGSDTDSFRTLDLRTGVIARTDDSTTPRGLINGSGPKRFWTTGGEVLRVVTWDGVNGWTDVGTLADGTRINQFGSAISPDGRFIANDPWGTGAGTCLAVADLDHDNAAMEPVDGRSVGCSIIRWDDERTLRYTAFENESNVPYVAVFSEDGSATVTQAGEPVAWNSNTAPVSAPSSYRAYQFPGTPLVLINDTSRFALSSIGAVTANDISRMPFDPVADALVVDRVDEIRNGTFRVTFNTPGDPWYVVADLPAGVVLAPPEELFAEGSSRANDYKYRLALADEEFGWTVYVPEESYGD